MNGGIFIPHVLYLSRGAANRRPRETHQAPSLRRRMNAN
jgi:hypothetical protein